MSPREPYPRDFADWFVREQPRMLAALTLVAGDPARARAVALYAFAKALDRWPLVRTVRSPAAWTYRVALGAARPPSWRRARRSDVALALHEIGGLDDVAVAEALGVETRTIRGILQADAAG
jgi:predicted RNA polymerase sigma factor